MANSQLSKITARLGLENGADAEGRIKYVNLNIGDLQEEVFVGNTKNASLEKLLALKDAIEPCLDSVVGYLETVETSDISA